MIRFGCLLATFCVMGCDGIGPGSNQPIEAARRSELSHGSPAPADGAVVAANETNRTTTAVAAAEPATSASAPAFTGAKLPVLSRDEIDAGWLRLFDGETTFGWSPNNELKWTIEDGVVWADEGPSGLLVTTSPFDDFELRCEAKVVAGGNSGIFLRTPAQPKDPATDCYELNICDTHAAFKSGSLVGRLAPTEPIAVDGDWHTYSVKAVGPRVEVAIDGKPALSYVDETATPLKRGFIGLQKNQGRAEFRNVVLRPLGLSDWFNGTDLTGWRAAPGSKSTFGVEDGVIKVRGGRGFLESEQTAGNFILQFSAMTHGDKLNSGVFFRSMTATEKDPSNGYEFQIQHGMKNGDPAQPDDAGTGAIFRRINARRIVAKDREWFTGTLIANEGRFCTWVDGVPMVDWIDLRNPHENPRQGSRRTPGHFSLQGHDPGTDLSFRTFRVRSWDE